MTTTSSDLFRRDPDRLLDVGAGEVAHRRIGTYPSGTIRVGVGPFNTEADVDALVQAVRAEANGTT